MRSRSSKRKTYNYEPVRRNPITLGDDSNIEVNLKPFKIDGKNSILELSESQLDIKGLMSNKGQQVIANNLTLDGDLILDSSTGITKFYNNGDAENYASLTVAANGATTIATTDSDGTSGDLTFDIDGDMFIDMAAVKIDVDDDGARIFRFQNLATQGGGIYMYSSDDENDYSLMYTAPNGATTWNTTAVSDSTTATLSIAPAGNLTLDPGTHLIRLLDNAIGFTQEEPTFDDTDTIITFSTRGNKQKLTLTDNCTDIHFKFPTVSGNFICVLLQDGTGGRTISNWKTQDAAGNAGAGNSGLVLWAGGTAPSNTETANKADIASFYWDADNEIAYGTYTYNF